MDRPTQLFLTSFLGILLISSGCFPILPTVGGTLVFSNQQDSEEPFKLSQSQGMSQQETTDYNGNNRWVFRPYQERPIPLDITSSSYFYSPLKAYLKRQDKGLMLDVGALAFKGGAGGGPVGSAQVESKHNSFIGGNLRNSG